MTDQYSYNEVKDRISIFAAQFEQFILEHKVVQETPQLKELAEKVSDILGEFSQATYVAATACEGAQKTDCDKQEKSQAELVRMVIDAFSPDFSSDMDETDLLDLIAKRVKEAIVETQSSQKKMKKYLDNRMV